MRGSVSQTHGGGPPVIVCVAASGVAFVRREILFREADAGRGRAGRGLPHAVAANRGIF